MNSRKTQVARGWGLQTHGPEGRLTFCFFSSRREVEENWIPRLRRYSHPVRVVLVPLAEYRRLKRIEKKVKP
jgi:hypothetical protein